MTSLIATIRDKKEKSDMLRKAGSLPGVLYGEGTKNVSVKVNQKDLEKTLKEAGETSIIALEVEGKKIDVLIHQVAKNAITDKIVHVDFFHPSSKKKIEAKVPLVFEGEAEAVKSSGGILIRELDEINLKGLAKDLPKDIPVDISVLKTLEDRITVGDLVLPAGLEIVGHHEEDIVAHVALPKEEEMKEPEQPAEGEGEAQEEEASEGGDEAAE